MVRMKNRSVYAQVWFATTLALMFFLNARADSGSLDWKHLERSFSLHASLDSRLEQDRPTSFASAAGPAESQIQNAARLLTFDYAANRLYLIYQKEISLPEAERVFQAWRLACPAEVEVVPALMLRSRGTNRVQIFSAAELTALLRFFKTEINRAHLAVLSSDDDPLLPLLTAEDKEGLARLALPPDQSLTSPFHAAVVETSKAFSGGGANDEWQQPGSGREMLRKLVEQRNRGTATISWNLGIVGTSNSTQNGIAPGRNGLAASEILYAATPNLLGGFSADLGTMQSNSRTLAHDGSGYSFYEMLKRGQVYVGFYAKPFHEVVKIYQSLRADKRPATQ